MVLAIGEIESCKSYNIMDNFIHEKINEENLRDMVYSSLDGRKELSVDLTI